MENPRKCAECWRLVTLNGFSYCPYMDIKYCYYGTHEPIPPELRPKKKQIPTFYPSRRGKFCDRWESIHEELIKDYYDGMNYKEMSKKYGLPRDSIKAYIRRVFNRQREELQI